MNFYKDLLLKTSPDREAFMAIPIIQHALENGVDKTLYLAYLCEAYHHVKQTCPLLACAAAQCRADDRRLQDALLDYIDEERGHDEWILNDIEALGGNVAAVRSSEGSHAVQIMVGYAFYAIEHVSPYSMLGMVHVLESVSAAIASQAAKSIRTSLGQEDGKGFTYLESHGKLDQEHVGFFEDLVNGIESKNAQDIIIGSTRINYRLFGDVFKDIGNRFGAVANAA